MNALSQSCNLQKRKELAKGDFRTKHTNWGHLLLGIGVLIGVEGPVNTYLRAGEIIPPHTYLHNPLLGVKLLKIEKSCSTSAWSLCLLGLTLNALAMQT